MAAVNNRGRFLLGLVLVHLRWSRIMLPFLQRPRL